MWIRSKRVQKRKNDRRFLSYFEQMTEVSHRKKSRSQVSRKKAGCIGGIGGRARPSEGPQFVHPCFRQGAKPRLKYTAAGYAWWFPACYVWLVRDDAALGCVCTDLDHRDAAIPLLVKALLGFKAQFPLGGEKIRQIRLEVIPQEVFSLPARSWRT